MSKNPSISPLMHELSAYIAGALKRKLPAEVAERARLHLVDVVASMVSGSRLLPGKRALAYIKPLGGTRIVPVLGKARSNALIAALYDISRLKNVLSLRRLYSA